ncbi:MAG: AraC family transcriptional regulator [Clostridia bacterium]|nr:AraC family transcriptional regulator [Clostridia bacterium]
MPNTKQSETFFDNILFRIPFHCHKIIIEHLRLFCNRLDCGRHQHPNFELHVITEGRVLYTFDDGREVYLGPNDLLFIMPGCAHSEKVLAPSLGIILGFYFKPQAVSSADPSDLEVVSNQVMQAFSQYKDSFYLLRDARDFVEKFREIYNELNGLQCGCLIVSQNLLVQTLIVLSRHINQTEVLVTLPKKTIQDNLHWIATQYFILSNQVSPDNDLSLKELASLLCLSERQTSRFLLNTFNKTFLELVNDAKITYAKLLLAQTTKSTEEIASYCGWTSKYFYHRFKQETGTTPMKYRKAHSGLAAPPPTAPLGRE